MQYVDFNIIAIFSNWCRRKFTLDGTLATLVYLFALYATYNLKDTQHQQYN